MRDEDAFQVIGRFQEALRAADDALDRVMILAAECRELSEANPNPDQRRDANDGYATLIAACRSSRDRLFVASKQFRTDEDEPDVGA